MAAANGRLYLCLKNGKVQCLDATNTSPTVEAGDDQAIYPMATAILDAEVSDDGFPFGTLTEWSKFAGPGEVVFADPNTVDTAASFSQWGSHTLRLTAFDGAASNYDDINVFVCRPGDLDCDGDVDIFDLDQLTAQWLRTGCAPINDWCDGADQAAVGKVNFATVSY